MSTDDLDLYERVTDHMNEQPLFFDIETEAHPNIEEWIEKDEVEFIPPDLDNVSAPSNWKDEGKIAEYITNKKHEIVVKAEADYLNRLAKIETDYQEEIDKAPLDPDLGSIISIGTRFGIHGDVVVRYVPKVWTDELEESRVHQGLYRANDKTWPFIAYAFRTEHDLIEHFWQLLHVARNQACGYGILTFDFPFLMRRSFEMGIKPLSFIDLRKFQIRPYKDLMPIIYNWTFKWKPMKWVASRYGIDNPNKGMSGDQVANMDEPTMLRYTAGDIHIITELYKKADGIYWPSEISG